MFFTATCEDVNNSEGVYKELSTFLICNPNAMMYQHMVNQPHGFYLKLFLNKNINVMVWNYRGYGLSKGKPNPYNIRKDAETILSYMREVLGLRGKFGVYGRSLGGIPTTHLCHKVDMVIADRTFSNFDILSQRKFYHKIARVLFKIGSCGWNVANDTNILIKGVDSCYKVLLAEKNDEVVEIHSSLMAGIARDLFGRKSLQPGEKFYLTT
jgi:hypothetical protein